ncbi:MAG TPA: bifunctional diaminohydroxyphosphoribosylaminopyrimidine deaminase/5-amino-6-(5-phosphoribosylamino)uracil reductase RibD, partial [Bacteroidia bacterium]|nr:bifunctional diaminohydroxyphosphoribosylaminopyrimidine deaminase/5-amino-6-(5-phosphoribosylamino)uracil reductase RibD [Bacteroidia bacterium]
MTFDETIMHRCLELAKIASGQTIPNPMVGSVLVFENKIIGEGYHQRAGEAHAEVNAINSVENKSLIPLSTLYVSLEPCSHYGKTPPCCERIVQEGIKKVI